MPPGPPELSLYAWLSVPIGVITLAERYGAERYGAERYGAERCERHGSATGAAATFLAMEADMAAALADFELRPQVRSAVAGGAIQLLGPPRTRPTLAAVPKDLLPSPRPAV